GPSGLSSCASIEIVRYPPSLARRSISLSRTVLPTPRSPVRSMLFSGRFFFTRPKRMRACSRTGSRPTSSGGGEPAPGENGFLIGSTDRLILDYTRFPQFLVISHPTFEAFSTLSPKVRAAAGPASRAIGDLDLVGGQVIL